ncbi:MAG: ABC transporter permease [Candidatus Njordarchaeia archaeon]|nr:ABC transporter permease [Candidatus Korarchaeota archaeon]
MWERLSAVIGKEWRQLIRDKRTIALVIALPLTVMTIFGLAYSGDMTGVKIALAIEDDGPLSSVIISEIFNSRVFDVVYIVDSFDEAKYLVEQAEVKGAIVIPAGFSTDIANLGIGSMYLILDGSWFNLPSAMQAEANRIISDVSDKIALSLSVQRGYSQPVSITLYSIWIHGSLKVIDIIGPTVMGIMVQQVPMTLAAISIVREREKGTLEKLLTTPMTRFDLIIGKLIPFAVVGVIIGISELFMVTAVFGAINRGTPLDVLITSLALALAALSLGLLFSVISRNQLQTMQISTFMLIVSFLFSGFLLPIEGMKNEIRFIVYVIPLYYFYQAIIGITIRGVSIIDVIEPILSLFLYALIFLVLSMALMSKRIG